jgi:hypothetical protein
LCERRRIEEREEKNLGMCEVQMDKFRRTEVWRRRGSEDNDDDDEKEEDEEEEEEHEERKKEKVRKRSGSGRR